MPAASLVVRAQHGAARARRRDQERHAAAGRAAPRASRVPASLKSAASATAARPPQRRPPAPATSEAAPSAGAHFPGFAISRLTHLGGPVEKSFGPIYARGSLPPGPVGVRGSRSQCLGNSGLHRAALTFGILWLDACRQLRGKVPGRRTSLVRAARLLRAHPRAHGQSEPRCRQVESVRTQRAPRRLIEIDCTDRGNVATRLVHVAPTNRPPSSGSRTRSLESTAILPKCEVAVLSPAELAFRWRGLEFARARMGAEAETFRSKQEIVFGVGAEERVLEDRNFPLLCAVAECDPAIPAIPMARASTRCSACVPNAGWNPWSWRTSA